MDYDNSKKELNYVGDNSKVHAIDRVSKSAVKRRQRRVSKLRIKPIYRKLSIIILIGVCIFALLWGLNSLGVTKIKHITVVESSGGTFTYIDYMELEESLNQNLTGISYYKLKDVEVNSLVDSFTSYAKEVSVEKLFPSTVRVSIEERVPVLTIVSGDSCGVIDESRTCLEVLIDDQVCEDIAENTNTKLLVADDLQLTFELNKKVSFYDSAMLLITADMLEQNGYLVDNYLYEDNTYTFYTEADQRIIFTQLEGYEMQQKRLLVSLSEINSSKIEFTSLDLRYERPVIKTK
jgi:cell division septal protein FtsQ